MVKMHDSWKKPNCTPPVILFATPPPLEQMRALTVRIDNQVQLSQTQPLAKFQPQVIKCREFIFTEPEVIGTPSLELKDNCFHLVAQVPLLQSGKVQKRLSRVGLQVTAPYEVTAELYQSCLRYTLIARISPSWNKAGEWLVQGRDFLTHTGAVNAIRMDLSVNSNELYFTLEAAALKFSPMKVTDLDILGDRIEKFLKHQIAEINHDDIASDWCFVLPSMKKGRIMRISHEIPDDSPFMSYRDLKRFWKNTYGYRLPESDEDIIYYQINFGPLGGRLFTYPEVCLRARDTQRVSRVDPKPILRAFVQELTSKFPAICGAPMKLQSKAKFPISQLFESGQKDPQSQPNLGNKLPSRPTNYRSAVEMERLLSARPPTASQMYPCTQKSQPPAVGPPSASPIYPCAQNRPLTTFQMYPGTQNTHPPASAVTQTNTHSSQSGQYRLSQPIMKVRQQEIQKPSDFNSSQVHLLDNYKDTQMNKGSEPTFNPIPMSFGQTVCSRVNQTPERALFNTNKQTNPSYSRLPNGSLISSSSSSQTPAASNSGTSCDTNVTLNHHTPGFTARQNTPDCVKNQQTPSQSNSSLKQIDSSCGDNSVARKLFPQFKPKKMSSQIISVPASLEPKLKPTFSIQKKQGSTNATIVKEPVIPPAFSTSVISNTAIPSSQSNLTSSSKSYPLFIKKSINSVKKPSLPEKKPPNKKAAGERKIKSASGQGKEKPAKRSIKGDGEGKRKKLKQSAQKSEQ